MWVELTIILGFALFLAAVATSALAKAEGAETRVAELEDQIATIRSQYRLEAQAADRLESEKAGLTAVVAAVEKALEEYRRGKGGSGAGAAAVGEPRDANDVPPVPGRAEGR